MRTQFLCDALFACDREDALAICTAFLEDQSTGGPELAPLFEATASTAQFWADVAPPHGLVAYGTAALARLGQTPLGLNTRKKLLVTLFESMSEDDRLRFARRIDPEGMVIRRQHG
ncbi:hypothetical protein [Paenirhodobacter sp.]|uniref:hypothetical protein n=1 Tax=Paenirhodobacter sp. TaxID=1965326 RepID=UPI003B50AED2